MKENLLALLDSIRGDRRDSPSPGHRIDSSRRGSASRSSEQVDAGPYVRFLKPLGLPGLCGNCRCTRDACFRQRHDHGESSIAGFPAITIRKRRAARRGWMRNPGHCPASIQSMS